MSCSYWSCPCPAAFGAVSMENALHPSSLSWRYASFQTKVESNRPKKITRNVPTLIISCCSDSDSTTTTTTTTSSSTESSESAAVAPPVIRKRTRYRKQYPGEKEGITEEMRFVAMRLRNFNGKKLDIDASTSDDDDDDQNNLSDNEDGGGGEHWQPSVEGFLKYLVDSKLVFDTVERIVDESKDVSYAYFRKTGLERSESLSKDLEWFSQQDIAIPLPSNPGITYVKYLEELAEKRAPLFLCHFYNIYFSHIAGGQVITKKVSEKILEGRESQFCRWEGNAEELFKDVREKLNMLGEHWSRDEKNKCLREATKSFRYLGQIVRLITL
ncbi:hypothetical protein CsSME_00013810 [Camellia sinensis var. sinensis]